MQRTTLRRDALVEGVGLFTGAPATLRIRPATPGAGLRIARADVDPSRSVPLDVRRASEAAPRNTTIEIAPDASVMTVEHALSALAGLGVTDATLEVSGPEMPAGDGSSAFIVEAILDAGLASLDDLVDAITPSEPIRVEGQDGAWIEIHPSERLEVAYELSYPDHATRLPAQTATWQGDAPSYRAAIAPARTFCLREEAEALQAAGLCTHLTTRDMLVFGEDGPIDNQLRFDDEPARHKLLDLVGDLALAGAPLSAKISARRSGHALNRLAARRLADLRTT